MFEHLAHLLLADEARAIDVKHFEGSFQPLFVKEITFICARNDKFGILNIPGVGCINGVENFID